MNYLFAGLGILSGAFAIVFGEFDDSPGLQGLGMLLILFILFKSLKARKSKTS